MTDTTMDILIFEACGDYDYNFLRPMSIRTLDAYMKLINDGSPTSGTHWSRCRGPQRIFAKSWLDSFTAKRLARRRARQAQATIYFLAGFIFVSTIWILKSVYK